MSFLARTRILLSLTVLTLTHQVLHLEKKMNRDEEFDKKAFAVRVRDRRVSTKVGYLKAWHQQEDSVSCVRLINRCSTFVCAR